MPVNDYLFSAGYSSVQGQDQWFYKQWDGAAYSDMSWNATTQRWQGSCTWCLIGRGWAHPDTRDAVIAWKAPRAGRVTIRGMMDSRGYTPNSDGVQTVIRQQAGTTVQQIWPSSGYQKITSNFMAQHVAQTTVTTGDWLYFHVNKNVTTSNDTLSWDPRISYDYEPRFTLDAAEVAITPSDFSAIGVTIAHDASLSMVTNGTDLDFFHTADHANVQSRFHGTLAKPVTGTYASPQFKNPNNLPGQWWVENTYQISSTELVAFCHIEKAVDANGVAVPTGWWGIGLAYSSDRGATFRKLGTVIGSDVPGADGSSGNVYGVPYVVKDGYFYAYYGEQQGPSVARARVSDVIAAARAGTVTPWVKFYDGTWTEPGLNGHASPVMPDPTRYAVHGDAAYSTYLGKYVLSGYTHQPGKGAFLAFSDDATSFGEPSWLHRSDATGKDALSPYETIVPVDAGTGGVLDNGVVGQSFYVYYGYRAKVADATSTDIANLWRWVYRQKVTLNRAGFDRNTAEASTGFGSVQKGDGWKYLSWNSTTPALAELGWDTGTARWVGGGDLAVTHTTQQPDGGADAVRSWTVPRTGTVRVTAPGGISVGAAGGADGVDVKLSRLRAGGLVQVWPASGYQFVAAGSTIPFPDTDVAVSAGDELFFQVNQHGNATGDVTTWAPAISYVGLDKITYDAWVDFSDTQGAEGWGYRQSDGSPMTYNPANGRYYGTAPYLIIGPTVQHADAGLESVRAWTAPKAGYVTISSRFGDISVATGSGADGVLVRVLLNSSSLWPATGSQLVPAGGRVPFSALVHVPVAAGDVLSFRVGQNVTTAYDTTTWVPMIAYED